MQSVQRHVLLVEDDLIARRIVEECLRQENIRVSTVGSLAAARATLVREAIDLVLLDLILPDGDGIRFCSELRQKSRVPVIILTSRGEANEVVEGLEAGADDYMVKPAAPRVIAARVKAHLRRAEFDRTPTQEILRIGDVTLHPDERRVAVRGCSVSLGAKEFELLLFLARRAGRVVRRHLIFEEMWPDAERSEKILNVYVRRIREKIEMNPSAPMIIETVRNVGYRFVR